MSWPESRVARDKSDFSSNRQATEAIAKMYKLKSPTGFALSIGCPWTCDLCIVLNWPDEQRRTGNGRFVSYRLIRRSKYMFSY